MARQSKRRSVAAEKAHTVAEAAREIAENESLKDFVSSTGSAVREFASNVSEAAKDLLDTTDKAAGKVSRKERKPRGRLRRILRLGAIVGAAGAILTNERARKAITSKVRKLRGGQEPPPWATQAAQTDGEVRPEAATQTTP